MAVTMGCEFFVAMMDSQHLLYSPYLQCDEAGAGASLLPPSSPAVLHYAVPPPRPPLLQTFTPATQILG